MSIFQVNICWVLFGGGERPTIGFTSRLGFQRTDLTYCGRAAATSYLTRAATAGCIKSSSRDDKSNAIAIH
jgi:hypothetical protein